MKSCKIVISALMLSLMATGSFAMQRRCSGSSCQRAPRPAPAAAPAPVRSAVQQPPVRGNGRRIAGFHVTSPEVPMYYRQIVDLQTPSPWIRISNSNPVTIPFNSDLTIMFARQANDQGATQLVFHQTTAAGKTILLFVRPTLAGINVQPDALDNTPMANGWGFPASNRTNINATELATCTNPAEPRIAAQAAARDENDSDFMSESDEATLMAMPEDQFDSLYPKAQAGDSDIQEPSSTADYTDVLRQPDRAQHDAPMLEGEREMREEEEAALMFMSEDDLKILFPRGSEEPAAQPARRENSDHTTTEIAGTFGVNRETAARLNEELSAPDYQAPDAPAEEQQELPRIADNLMDNAE